MSRMLRLWMSLLVWSCAGLVAAHDVSPAYFEISADALARSYVHSHDATQPTTPARPAQPGVDVPATAGPSVVAGMYLMQGIADLPLGYGHSLFMLALLLIARWASLRVPNRRRRLL